MPSGGGRRDDPIPTLIGRQSYGFADYAGSVLNARTRGRPSSAGVLRALKQISAADAASPAEVAEVAARCALELAGADGAAIYIARGPGEGLSALFTSAPQGRSVQLAARAGVIELAYRSSEPVWALDHTRHPAATPLGAERGIQSAAALPMVADGRAIGALGIWSRGRLEFDQVERELLTLFAALVGQAVAGAVRAREREQQNRLMSALRELAISCASVRDPVQVAELVADQAAALVGANSGFISWADRPGGSLRRLYDSEPEITSPVLSWEQGISGATLEANGPVIIHDYPAYERAVPSSVANGTRSMLAVPLVLSTGPSGVLGVRSHSLANFTQSDAEALALIAAQAAPALRLAGQHAETQSRVGDLQALHEVAVAAGGILDAGALAQLAVDHAVRVLDSTGAALRWWESGCPVWFCWLPRSSGASGRGSPSQERDPSASPSSAADRWSSTTTRASRTASSGRSTSASRPWLSCPCWWAHGRSAL